VKAADMDAVRAELAEHAAQETAESPA
jgi:hypothetical protein